MLLRQVLQSQVSSPRIFAQRRCQWPDGQIQKNVKSHDSHASRLKKTQKKPTFFQQQPKASHLDPVALMYSSLTLQFLQTEMLVATIGNLKSFQASCHQSTVGRAAASVQFSGRSIDLIPALWLGTALSFSIVFL